MPILKNLKHHKALLDTHVLIWTMIGDSHLTDAYREFYEKAIQSQGIFISPMSIWEIGMLVEKRRIQLDREVLDWVNQILDIKGHELISISPKIAIESSRLPGEAHGDPVDRMLIATAHEENAVLITCDQKILKYGKDKYLSVFDPTKNF